MVSGKAHQGFAMVILTMGLINSALSGYIKPWNYPVHFKKQANIQCKSVVPSGIMSKVECASLCSKKFDSLCIGFNISEETCQLCLVGRPPLATWNDFLMVQRDFARNMTKGKAFYSNFLIKKPHALISLQIQGDPKTFTFG